MSDTPPADLLAAFRACELNEDIAVLMVDDGFDADAIRVLAAWKHTEHRWSLPAGDRPADASPTPAAWKWLVRGWELDVMAVADASDTSVDVARAKLDLLVGNRLIYPSGEMHSAARKAISTHVAQRLKLKVRKAKKVARDNDDGDN